MEKNRKLNKYRRKFYGEDSETLLEKNRDSKKRRNDNICDTHIDGA